jgi:hypothetical protein
MLLPFSCLTFELYRAPSFRGRWAGAPGEKEMDAAIEELIRAAESFGRGRPGEPGR